MEETMKTTCLSIFTFLSVFLTGIGYVFAQQASDAFNTSEYLREWEKAQFEARHAFPPVQPSLAQSQFDVHFYNLNLDIHPESSFLQGSVAIAGVSLTPGLERLEIDLYSNMIVESVLQNGVSLNFQRSGNRVDIQLPTPLQYGEFFSIQAGGGGAGRF